MAKTPALHPSEPDRFGWALAAAALIEAGLLLGFLLAPRPPREVPPAVVQIQLLPPAPAPVAKPPPPKPAPPAPKPPPPKVQPPPPPLPAAVPLPPPPLLPPPRPRPSPRHVIRHIVHVPPPPPPVAAPVTPPLPAAPVTAAPPPSPVAEQTALSRYIGEVRGIVDAHLVVPQQLIDAGLSGDCVLAFTVAPDGEILSARVVTPSGLAVVNEAALAALRGSQLPPFPPGMADAPHEFTLPVRVSGAQE